MNAIQFEQANTLYIAEGCGDLPVSRTIDSEMKCLSLVSCWEPTDEEMTYMDIMEATKLPKKMPVKLIEQFNHFI